eukprot:GHVU01230759.1.p1 GENE.GHVU01230759.1~~GHVU01230759.1.p1  ORF type:complete len:385 (+),score=59.11 GHVU01230759.1:54-1157(+)
MSYVKFRGRRLFLLVVIFAAALSFTGCPAEGAPPSAWVSIKAHGRSLSKVGNKSGKEGESSETSDVPKGGAEEDEGLSGPSNEGPEATSGHIDGPEATSGHLEGPEATSGHLEGTAAEQGQSGAGSAAQHGPSDAGGSTPTLHAHVKPQNGLHTNKGGHVNAFGPGTVKLRGEGAGTPDDASSGNSTEAVTTSTEAVTTSTEAVTTSTEALTTTTEALTTSTKGLTTTTEALPTNDDTNDTGDSGGKDIQGSSGKELGQSTTKINPNTTTTTTTAAPQSHTNVGGAIAGACCGVAGLAAVGGAVAYHNTRGETGEGESGDEFPEEAIEEDAESKGDAESKDDGADDAAAEPEAVLGGADGGTADENV